MNAAGIIDADTLRRIPLFQSFNATDCSQVLDVASVALFQPDRMILEQGGASRDLWVLLEGRCEVSRRLDLTRPEPRRITLATLEPPGHFGDMSFFSPSPHSADVKAVTSVKLLRISHADYQDLLGEGVQAAYKLAYNVTEALVRRLRRMDDWVTELAASGCDHDHLPQPEWQSFREKLFDHWTQA
jgi:CRP-like cAMP-binding protein